MKPVETSMSSSDDAYHRKSCPLCLRGLTRGVGDTSLG
jgi:hypothetical protein